ncbi:hypothetical protein Srufu_062440 [Streptomyces libani subsp. rufus]|nr:hypothetical protein Srufu_062440 [Streptomyces libani subsp. rufus]
MGQLAEQGERGAAYGGAPVAGQSGQLVGDRAVGVGAYRVEDGAAGRVARGADGAVDERRGHRAAGGVGG